MFPLGKRASSTFRAFYIKGWIPISGIIQTKINNFKVIDFTHDIYTLEGQKKFPRYLVEKRSN